MCSGIQCVECEERYECESYKAYLGFGSYNNSVVSHKSSKIKNLDYYENPKYRKGE